MKTVTRLAIAAVASGSLCAAAREPRTMHVYHIGNSLTRSITMDRLHLLFAEHGIDYQALWERAYPFDETASRPKGDQCQSRDYFSKLIACVDTELAPKLGGPVRMIPVGEVWYECDKRIKAAAIPGLAELYARGPAFVPGWKPDTGIKAGVNVFYADGIHPNPMPHLTGNVPNYVNGLTICAVLSGKSPVGMTGAIYGMDDEGDAALIRALQETVWEVVKRYPHSGTGLPGE